MKRRGGSTDDDDVGSGNKISHSNNNKKGKTKNPPNNPRPEVIGTVANCTNLFDLMDPLLQNINSYLPNEDVMKVACVSKRLNTIIPRATTYESRAPGTLIPVLRMGPSKTNEINYRGDCGRLQLLVQQLHLHRTKLQRYQHASLTNYHDFHFNPNGDVHLRIQYRQYKALVEQIKTHGPRIEGITSLDFGVSSSTTPTVTVTPATPAATYLQEMFVLKILPYLLPSLREVDFTNTVVLDFGMFVKTFFEHCPCLEKFKYHNRHPETRWGSLSIDGSWMTAANNLKALIIDDYTFTVWFSESEMDAMSNLEDNDDDAVSSVFLFHKCSSTVLERVSLRKARYYCVPRERMYNPPQTAEPHTAIPQQALIKFIRHAPTTLRWFRSNLTTENIKMLHHERPEIEFVS